MIAEAPLARDCYEKSDWKRTAGLEAIEHTIPLADRWKHNELLVTFCTASLGKINNCKRFRTETHKIGRLDLEGF